jgi:hypothetical protein
VGKRPSKLITEAHMPSLAYESKTQSPITRARFVKRLLAHLLIAIALLCLSIGIGMSGYAYLEHLNWLDAFLNTAMLLGGMGPVNPPVTNGGKLFAGLVFIVSAALVFTPIVHRVLHKFHWDT